MSFFLTNLSLSGDSTRPSFFEVVAHQRLMEGLKPALKAVLQFISERYPSALPLLQYGDEVYYSLLYLLESQYLSAFDSSFSENFFGLLRVRRNETISPIQDIDRRNSLLALVTFPYLRDVLHVYYQRLKGDDVAFDPSSATKTVKFWFVMVYPYVNVTYEALGFVYYLGYLFEATGFDSPLMHFLKLQLRRCTATDHSVFQQRAAALARERQSPLSSLLQSLVNYTKYSFLLGILVFKFLEWWYASEDRIHGSEKLPVPNPPVSAGRAAEGVKVPQNKSLCAICRRNRMNPACIGSGYVFCYVCVFNYVSQYERCPVTHSKSSVDQVRRIYDE